MIGRNPNHNPTPNLTHLFPSPTMLLRQGPIVFRKHHRPLRRLRGAAAVVGPVLVGATYDQGSSVDLTFDRAIDISALDPAQVEVDDDQDSGWRLGGQGGATLVDPMTVQVPLDRIGDSSESGVHLFVSASSGIVASGDGAAWAGVSDVALPFP